MTISMYQASVPVFLRQFSALSAILDKGVAFAASTGMDESELIDTRLAPDMAALPKQIQIASDSAKGCVSRLAGVDAPSFSDDETTFPELQARIAKTVAYLNTFTPEQLDGTEAKQIELKFGANAITLDGQSFLLHFALPNFFFHVTTAYGILRHSGVAIGKMDFLGAQ